MIGVFSLGCGFAQDKVALFILRALAGIGAAMTVPSALSLIIEWFPAPDEQARGIALFGGCGALGNGTFLMTAVLQIFQCSKTDNSVLLSVLGVVIGGAFVQWATWRWIMWFTAILGVMIALASIITVPDSAPRTVKPDWRRLDLGGVSLITIAVILFVYSVTSGSTTGWANPGVLAPLVVSIFLAVCFFVYEAYIDPSLAALPTSVWKYKNVPILIGIGLLPFLWWGACKSIPLYHRIGGLLN